MQQPLYHEFLKVKMFIGLNFHGLQEKAWDKFFNVKVVVAFLI